ncbi:MAG: effector binding domain-containing protein [Theionarchaea archaeon]|nr:effector binding domain-containing protein [Theionarchaea archaeon]
MDENGVDRSNDELVSILNECGQDITLMLRALANKNRLHVVTELLTGSQTFSELQKVTGLGKTALAHHLKLLVEVGVLNHTERGRYNLSRDGKNLVSAVSITYADSKRRREQKAAKRADYIQKIHTKEGLIVKEFTVSIVKLEPMRVASARAISETPEHSAWEKMRAWAEPKGLLQDIEKHPVFGFNNPNPSPGQKEYGYEFWIRVGPDVKPQGEIEIKDVEGGLFAVTTCNLKEELESEYFKKTGCFESWKKMVDWVESSKYTPSNRQWLEKAHDPTASDDELILDLYCPIEE